MYRSDRKSDRKLFDLRQIYYFLSRHRDTPPRKPKPFNRRSVLAGNISQPFRYFSTSVKPVSGPFFCWYCLCKEERNTNFESQTVRRVSALIGLHPAYFMHVNPLSELCLPQHWFNVLSRSDGAAIIYIKLQRNTIRTRRKNSEFFLIYPSQQYSLSHTQINLFQYSVCSKVKFRGATVQTREGGRWRSLLKIDLKINYDRKLVQYVLAGIIGTAEPGTHPEMCLVTWT